MLNELYIQNFALIDQLTVAFSPGLNILTGETGAGKSIVIDAINVLLGERAGTDLVRTGATRACLQATFDVALTPHLLPALADLGVEPEDGLLILARDVALEGRNVARINGRQCPVSTLKQVGDLLVDLHGQHEHQSLIREDQHLAYLDALGDEAFIRTKATVADLARQRARLLDELAALHSDERDRLRAIDLIGFQVEEIDRAELMDGEDEQLAVERNRLANAEKLYAGMAAAYCGLYEGDDEGRSVLDMLGDIEMQLASIARIDPQLDNLVTAIQAASEQLAETAHEMQHYRDGLQFDPERLSEVDERLTLINTLKRKYGDAIPVILHYAEEKRAEFDRLVHYEERIDEVQAEIARVEATLTEHATRLSAARRVLGDALAASVQAELAHLGMMKAVFQVHITRQPQATGLLVDGERVAVTPRGIDQVAFYLSANAGEPPKPLAKIASGGELSRVMLALKAVAARGSGVPTLVFDEIDTGIGGRTAEAVGEKLARVAGTAQVICVTHLAQLAFYADTHFLLSKAVDGARTVSRMTALDEQGRIEELARLQAGGRVSEAVLAHIRGVLEEIRSQRPTSV
jgi:DNA repair protein RecN (Recombination protein N)